MTRRENPQKEVWIAKEKQLLKKTLFYYFVGVLSIFLLFIVFKTTGILITNHGFPTGSFGTFFTIAFFAFFGIPTLFTLKYVAFAVLFLIKADWKSL